MSNEDPSELKAWRRIRRYAVPRQMIDECTLARYEGDWQATCAAGRVDVAFHPGDLRTRFGVRQAERLAADLRSFAPDLLRWHLPRAMGGYTTVLTDAQLVLWPAAVPIKRTTPLLVVRTPKSVLGTQRLVLDIVLNKELRNHAIHVAAHRWDVRAAAELRTVVGGSNDRLPRFAPDGTPLPVRQWGAGDDIAARTERVLAHLERGEDQAAWEAAGIALTMAFKAGKVPPWWHREPNLTLMGAPVDPTAIVAEVRSLAANRGESSWALTLDYLTRFRLEVEAATGAVTARFQPYEGRESPFDKLPRITSQFIRRLPDLDLIWQGRMTAGELHPLVRDALFPAAPPAGAEPAPEAIRVRCGTDWHFVGQDSGRLRIAEHDDAEVQRERVMRALGGPMGGCFAVDQAWTAPVGRLPKELHRQRQGLWMRMLHGGTRTAVELLDTGMPPQLCDGRGRTLLHMLGTYDHAVLLPRLLAAGLDVDLRDGELQTPLAVAVSEGWPPAAIIALVDAGANPHLTVANDMSVLDYLDRVLPSRQISKNADFMAAVEYVRKRA
ncbi:hypothetical protein GCM10009765_73690 [Fodinicola feengrottensis]|uniref:Ankyrin repeat domain-containing protein n=1 Tax=Fodinicola feengrottensis TaxID=435914 RepID=A0ABN2IXX2_9ACTN